MGDKFITAAECVIIKEALEKYKAGFTPDGVIAGYCDSLIGVFQAYADNGGIEGATDTETGAVTITDPDDFMVEVAAQCRAAIIDTMEYVQGKDEPDEPVDDKEVFTFSLTSASEMRATAAALMKLAAEQDAEDIKKNINRIRIDESAGDINGNVITAAVENVLSLREIGRPYGA